MNFRDVLKLASRFWTFICYVLNRQVRAVSLSVEKPHAVSPGTHFSISPSICVHAISSLSRPALVDKDKQTRLRKLEASHRDPANIKLFKGRILKPHKLWWRCPHSPGPGWTSAKPSSVNKKSRDAIYSLASFPVPLLGNYSPTQSQIELILLPLFLLSIHTQQPF